MSCRSLQQVRHGADVVLVAVREHDADDVVEAVPDGREVGQDQVDAGLVLLGEQHAAVDDEQLAVELVDGHVAADLAETAERDDAEGAGGESGRVEDVGLGMRSLA